MEMTLWTDLLGSSLGGGVGEVTRGGTAATLALVTIKRLGTM